jgi:hypothetical protein
MRGEIEARVVEAGLLFDREAELSHGFRVSAGGIERDSVEIVGDRLAGLEMNGFAQRLHSVLRVQAR